MRFISFDLETGGLDSSTGISELAAVTLRVPDCRTLNTVHSLVSNPTTDLTTHIHGLTYADTIGQGMPWDLLLRACELSGSKRPVFVGHNILFDWRFLAAAGPPDVLRTWLVDAVLIDTSVHIDWQQYGVSGKKLVHICGELGIPTNNAHGALIDALMCARLIDWYLNSGGFAPTTKWDQLLAAADAEIMTIVPAHGTDGAEFRMNGFYWNGERRRWERRILKTQIVPVTRGLPFATDVVAETGSITMQGRSIMGPSVGVHNEAK